MDAEKFISTVVGTKQDDDRFYCLLAIKDKKVKQQFFKDIPDLVAAAEQADAEKKNAYFGLGTFVSNLNRKGSNVDYINTFFLDIDAGPHKEADKSYPDQAEAVSALRDFCLTYKLPKPTIVDSGYGVHVYWVLDKPVPRDTWIPVARGLKKICAEHGFKADAAVTDDVARVLRIPGTHNHLTENPLEVTIYGDPKELPTTTFTEFEAKVGRVDIVNYDSEENAVSQRMQGNTENCFKRILDKTAAGKGCEQLATIITNQDSTSEPLWRAGLSIARFCTDGDKASRLISNKHPNYNSEETHNKLDNVKGPYTCAVIDSLNTDVCPQCPHWGKIKSPIVLGKVVAELNTDTFTFSPVAGYSSEESEEVEEVEEVEESEELEESVVLLGVEDGGIPKYPKPYTRGKNGGIYLTTRDDDGDDVQALVYHNDLYVVKRVFDAEDGESVVMRLHLPMDGAKEFTLSLATVTSREELRKALAVQGVVAHNMNPIMSYVVTWVNQLQEQSKAGVAHKQFGWTNDAMQEFVLGDRIYSKSGSKANAPTKQTDAFIPHYEPRGTLEEWKGAMSIWNRPGCELYQYVLCAGIGSIFMELSNVNASTLHLHNEFSGVAKTTAMYAAQGVWGNPKALTLTNKDTIASKFNRGELFHNLPWTFDELTNIDPAGASDLIYAISDGQQRNRMTANSNLERWRGREWKLGTITTGNSSMLERVAKEKKMPRAEAQRVLECFVPNVGHLFTDKAETDRFTESVLKVYGHAGPLVVQYTIDNIETVKGLFHDVQKRVDRDGQLKQENRFWSAGITCTIMGAIIAKQLGLIDYDTKAIYRWVMTVLLPQNKLSVSQLEASVEDIMADFFSENISNILQIRSTADVRQSGESTEAVPSEALARGRLVARYETDTGDFFINPKALREWCVPLQLNFEALVKRLKEGHKGRYVQKRMGKGTKLNIPKGRVLQIHFSFGGSDSESSDL